MAEEISINIKGPSELKLTISISLEKTVRDLKEAISAQADVPADRQRLIYSGKVLKDEDVLSVYKIQSAHTVHMVKGAARSSTGESSTPQALPTMQAGQIASDPLTQLNGPRGHGVLAGLNPFAGTGLNVNDPNMMQGMMDSPQFLQQMSTMMSNPAVMEQLLASDPNMAHMAPQIRAMMQSPQFQQMVSNPETLRQMFQMSAQMRASGFNPSDPNAFGAAPGGAGANPFPFGMLGPGAFGGAGAGGAAAAGTPSNANASGNLFAQAAQGGGAGAAAAGSPGAGAGAAPPFNPFAMFGPPPTAGAGAGAGTTGATPGSPGTAPNANPFGFGAVDPNLMNQMFGGYGGFGGFPGAGAGAPAAPADSRPPEERFEAQLQQMNEMGLVDARQNIRALMATGGNVQAAIEYIFSGGAP